VWYIDLDIHEMVRRDLEGKGVNPNDIGAILLSQTSPGFNVGTDLELHPGQKLRIAMRTWKPEWINDPARQSH
jgi:hypothetical protein